MLLTIATTHRPATDLGYLLHKNPGRLQSFPLPFGRADVFYPEATPERCAAALLLDIDPVGAARSRGGSSGTPSPWLDHFINDRPYVASSHLSVAIASVFGSALAGSSRRTRPMTVQRRPAGNDRLVMRRIGAAADYVSMSPHSPPAGATMVAPGAGLPRCARNDRGLHRDGIAALRSQ